MTSFANAIRNIVSFAGTCAVRHMRHAVIGSLREGQRVSGSYEQDKQTTKDDALGSSFDPYRRAQFTISRSLT